jgi:hypothetical protein
MKRVFSCSSVIPCDLAKSVLEAAGIFAVLKHELGSAAAGYSWPCPITRLSPGRGRRWVSDEDYERALEILSTVDTDVEEKAPENLPDSPSPTV